MRLNEAVARLRSLSRPPQPGAGAEAKIEIKTDSDTGEEAEEDAETLKKTRRGASREPPVR